MDLLHNMTGGKSHHFERKLTVPSTALVAVCLLLGLCKEPAKEAVQWDCERVYSGDVSRSFAVTQAYCNNLDRNCKQNRNQSKFDQHFKINSFWKKSFNPGGIWYIPQIMYMVYWVCVFLLCYQLVVGFSEQCSHIYQGFFKNRMWY